MAKASQIILVRQITAVFGNDLFENRIILWIRQEFHPWRGTITEDAHDKNIKGVLRC